MPTIQNHILSILKLLIALSGENLFKAKVMWIKWLGEQNIEISGAWPGNSPDLNRIENLWSILNRVDKQNPTNSNSYI